uniref:LSDAT_euk domain-containing protein n=1 Tax=Echinostoma caproni TaxID=27848 RepID=A0A183AEY3_9TREM
LHYDTSPEVVLQLLLHEWRIGVPNLVISTLGGLANAPLQSKLKRVVQSGLLRAAKTIGAWVITNGLDIGVTRHIGDALGDEVHVRGSNIVALGIAPWGYVQHRETLMGLDHTCAYYSQGWKPGRQEAPLHSHHNYFLLADNGTTGKFGGELCLRRRLEQYLAQQPIDMRRYGGSKSRVPIVGVLLEGGAQTFRTVFELVTGRNPVPVVVCDGSGRAADLLAFMHRYANEDGDLPGPLKEQMIGTIGRTFQLRRGDSEGLYSELRLCMKRRRLISVFRMGEGDSDEIDITILTALLQVSSQKLTPAEQLSLTMAWDRPDIARTKVFTSFNQWSTTTLENAMADALLNDRLNFVRLLLAKGLDIQSFLTVGRLEDLYIAASDANNQSFHKLFAKVMGPRQRITLRAIGQLIEDLIGGGYQHTYCDKTGSGQLPSPEHCLPTLNAHLYSSDPHLSPFTIVRQQAATALQEEKVAYPYPNKSVTYTNLEHAMAAVTGFQVALAHWHPPTTSTQFNSQTQNECKPSARPSEIFIGRNGIPQSNRSSRFRYPYTELLQWALLTRRYEMARFMVLAGEESIAKALFSVKLLRSIRHSTVDDDSEPDLAQQFRDQESAFERLAVELQDHCYRHDPDQAKRLLTYELHAFSDNTCLSLAYMCESKEFIGHACTQSILNDLWYGGLRQGKMVGAKVALILIGLAFPPIYPLIVYCFSTRSKFIEFKTKEELAQQPQTLQEHLDDLESSSSTSSSASSSSSSSSSRSHSPSSAGASGHSSRGSSRRSSQAVNAPITTNTASRADTAPTNPSPSNVKSQTRPVMGALGDQPTVVGQAEPAFPTTPQGSLHSAAFPMQELSDTNRRGHHRRRKPVVPKCARFRNSHVQRNSLTPIETEDLGVTASQPPVDGLLTVPAVPPTRHRRRRRVSQTCGRNNLGAFCF